MLLGWLTLLLFLLLQVTRWLEPFIDYGPDYNRTTPLYDATIALMCRARELLTRRGAKEPEASWRADSVSLLPLCFSCVGF
jgi:hypothetical protein